MYCNIWTTVTIVESEEADFRNIWSHYHGF